MAMFSSFCSRRFSHVSGMSSEVVPWVEGPCARWPCPSIACWSRIVLRLEAIVQNIRWSRVARRLMQYQRSCWNFYYRAVGGDGNAPASTICSGHRQGRCHTWRFPLRLTTNRHFLFTPSISTASLRSLRIISSLISPHEISHFLRCLAA